MTMTPVRPRDGGPRSSLPDDAAVTSHRRGGRTGPGSRLWTVRTQLLAPILVAMLGLGVLGTAQTTEAAANASDAHRAQVLATTATTTVRLVNELERELAETVALRARGGKAGVQLVTAQRARVDQAISRYRTARRSAQRAAPELGARFAAVDDLLDQLRAARAATNRGTPPGSESDPVFHDLDNALLAVADALPAQLRDPVLAAAAREVAAVAAVEHYQALLRDRVRTILIRGSLAAGELTDLARLDGAREQREAEFTRVASAEARQRYEKTVTGTDVEKAVTTRSALLTGEPAALKTDADAWYVVQSTVIRRINLVGLDLSDRLDQLAANLSASATRRAWLTAIGTVGLGLTALFTAIILAVRTSRRLRRLRAAALTVARRELPETIAAVIGGAPPEHGAPAIAATRAIADNPDEVGEVADAFSSVYRTALRLAADQAQLRLDVARMAETFARRMRTLVTRQLRLLDEFERDETDPDALSRLFALDHLAARLRRNGENLLVLAGGEPGRTLTEAFPLVGAVTAAASEIEDFHRVECQPMDAAVAGPVVGDLVHLLAELLENAATFSPPDSPVRVDARSTVDGVVLRVHDSGIGLTPGRLAEVNARLAQRNVALSGVAAGTMGLYVVAHLAARHGIRVRLYRTADGTTAVVLLPSSVLAPAAAISAPLRLAPDLPQLVRQIRRTGPQQATEDRTLPHRNPGADVFNAPPAPDAAPTRLDPEEVRNRLSALAEGVSAAQRRNRPAAATRDR